jgi:hypothetical protein
MLRPHPKIYSHRLGSPIKLICILEDKTNPEKNPIIDAKVYILIQNRITGKYLNFYSLSFDSEIPYTRHKKLCTNEKNGLFSFLFDPNEYSNEKPRAYWVYFQTTYWGEKQEDIEEHNFFE